MKAWIDMKNNFDYISKDANNLQENKNLFLKSIKKLLKKGILQSV